VPFPEELRALAEPPSPGFGSRALCPIGFAQKLQRLGVEPPNACAWMP
jgi:hypothetical protein